MLPVVLLYPSSFTLVRLCFYVSAFALSPALERFVIAFGEHLLGFFAGLFLIGGPHDVSWPPVLTMKRPQKGLAWGRGRGSRFGRASACTDGFVFGKSGRKSVMVDGGRSQKF